MVVQAGSADQAVTADREGAAPAVMGRAATALLDGASIPWDSGLNERAREHMERMEGEGQRVRMVTGDDVTTGAAIAKQAGIDGAAILGADFAALMLTTDSFNSKQMNYAMLGEFVLAVLVTQMDVFNRLLGTVQINLCQFAWAFVPAIALLVLWELGKLIARRSAARAKTSPATK